MYLRNYAQCIRSQLSKPPEATRNDAQFRVSMTLTAPLLALSIIVGAVINRAFPGTLTRNSLATFVFGTAVLSICFLVRFLVKRWAASIQVPANVAALYGSGA